MFAMKVVIGILLLYEAMHVVLPFDLHGSMDKTRSAIESFYDSIHNDSKTELKKKLEHLENTLKLQKVEFEKLRQPYLFFGKTLTAAVDNLQKSMTRTETNIFTLKQAMTKSNSNKFAQVVHDIEKALVHAQGFRHVKHNVHRVVQLRRLIKTAVQKRSYRFARKCIGEAMFTIHKIDEQQKGKGRGKRSTASLTSNDFLQNVNKTIGASEFSKLLAMEGDVTLMFAIDDTGSMREEIQEAKKIAKSIIDQPRTIPVEYVLSPFNDPGTGPVTYIKDGERKKFVKAIESLRPHGGGDCPELAFKGMINAIDAPPQKGSPLYVFTDACPKDDTQDNVDYVKINSYEDSLVTYFFAFDGSKCSRVQQFLPFLKIAHFTSGQLFILSQVEHVKHFHNFTATSLAGTSILASAIHFLRPKRKKRSSSNSKISMAMSYLIPIDDSIDTLVISVTTNRPRMGGKTWNVSLNSPEDAIKETTSTLDMVALYHISKPSVGNWSLHIEADTNVGYNFLAQGSTTDNINFEFFFVWTIVHREINRTIPIPSPIQGREAEAILTLSGVAKVDLKTVEVELVALEGDTITTNKSVALTSRSNKGVRYSFKFHPPKEIFKIKLKGKTKKGNPFQRIGDKLIKRETLLVRIIFVRNHYTVAKGRTSYAVFTVENYGGDEVVDYKCFGSLIVVERQSRRMGRALRGRRASFFVTFRGKAHVTKGETVTTVVSVKGRKSGSKSVISVPFLVV